MAVLRFLLWIGLGVLGAVALLRALFPLPPLEPRPGSPQATAYAVSPLARGAATLAAEHPGLSGVRLLNDGRTAFAARVALARAAKRTLDLQYYIWRGDLSGSLLLHETRLAADRGVRVRLLLDDNGTGGLDAPLAALDRHPGIEVRLFNPFVIRRPKFLGYLADFSRLNRRMHNKSFTADGAATIVGGRNVGDEYFGAADQGLFADLDALAVGPVVGDVQADFDRYWRSASAYPAARILPAILPRRVDEIAAAAALASREPQAREYMQAVATLPFGEQLKAGALDFTWAPVRMVSDDPAKALGRAPERASLMAALRRAIETPTRSLDLVSGYFVPTDAGMEAFAGIARRGVPVRVLTNAWEATDVGLVHVGYAPRREALLRSGVRLFELRRPDDGGKAVLGTPRLLGTGSGSGSSDSGTALPSSITTLHAKTFAVDGRGLFVGSFNFDPRSIHLNTELGFLIDSPSLAAAVTARFTDQAPRRAYEVVLSPAGDLNWIERDGRREIRHSVEPGTDMFQRTAIRVLSWLPIEWML